MRRLTDTIRDFVAVAKSARAGEIVFAATSFLRDARNRDEIVRRVKEETGAEIRVLTSGRGGPPRMPRRGLRTSRRFGRRG